MQPCRTSITLITVMPSNRDIALALREINEEYNAAITMKVFSVNDIEGELVPEVDFRQALSKSDIVLVDVRGGNKTAEILQEMLPQTQNTVIVLVGGASRIIRLVRMNSFRMDSLMASRDSRIMKWLMRWISGRFIATGFDLEEMNTEVIYDADKLWRVLNNNPAMKIARFFPVGRMRHMRNWTQAIQYWSYRDPDNVKNLLIHVASNYGTLRARAAPPNIPPESGIYHPDAPHIFNSLSEYKNWKGWNRDKTVGILLYGGMHFNDSKPTTDYLIRTLEQDANVIPFQTSKLTYWKGMEQFFFEEGHPLVDAVLHVIWWRLNGGPLGGSPIPTLHTLEKLNAPVLMTSIMAMSTIDKWQESEAGLSPMDLIGAVMMPELDGCIEPIPSCGLANHGYDEEIGAPSRSMEVMEDRCLKISKRTINWINLKQKENKDKKIAIVLYNYPPGEDNLGGGAAYLDVFQSLLNILQDLHIHGYTVGALPETKEELIGLFLQKGLVNSGEWNSYDAPDCVTVLASEYEKWFDTIPESLHNQITEVWGEPPGEIMCHGKQILIPGIVIGNVFIGVQPSRGIHENPQLICHDRSIPPHHQYVAFYQWLENGLEADAVIHLGTHGTLEFTPGKEAGLSQECSPDLLIGHLPNIYVYWIGNTSEATIAKRRCYATLISHMSPTFTNSGLYDEYADLEDLIHEYYEARSKNTPRSDIVYQQIVNKSQKIHMTGSVDELYDQLFEMKRSIIPRGLHVLENRHDDDDLVDFMAFVLRYDRGNIKSLHRIIANRNGLDYDELLRSPDHIIQGRTYAQILADIELEVRSIALDLVHDHNPHQTHTEDTAQTISFARKIIEQYNDNAELHGIRKALNGDYITPNHGGDPVRSPEVLPTGGNVYQFNPYKIPTSAAYERGSQAAEQMLRTYINAHGRYPENVGIVLWGFETMNTNGETIGLILSLIGVKVIQKEGGYFPDLEVIPLKDLGRPRIDVVITICGIFRDTFPNLIELLDRAFKLVSGLDEDEDQNRIACHTKELERAGVEKRLCHLRTFGPQASEYGTPLTTLIETSSWQDTNQLAEMYITSMSNIYGHNIHATTSSKVFNHLVSTVDVCSQIRDHHDYEVTDLDHYYEFLGGLSCTVQALSDHKPDILVTDTTKEVIKTEDIADTINRGIRTRTCNPKWIDAMLDHGYDGTLNIADRVEYVLGLAVTTDKVQNWVWDDITDRIVLNMAVMQQMTDTNPWAAARIVGRLLEAEKRGYWYASDEQVTQLRQIYLDIEGQMEDISTH
ncbi:MAG: magnesium chelatase subunit H [Chloroflexota bacterium]|nr:magnesium chelatase subunit H [Chloroflexota bacterium]